MNRLLPTTAALAVVLLSASCGSGDLAATPSTGGPIRIVASTDVYGSIATAVGGDAVRVTSIISDSGSDPLAYESTPADATAVAAAQVVLYNGNGYDDFMPQLVEAAGGSRTVLDASEVSGLAPTAEAAGQEFNEHVWYSLPTVKTLAMTLATDLGEQRPAEAAAFTANATAFTQRVDELQASLARLSSNTAGRRAAVTEPLANYLLQDAGLENAAPEKFQEAVEEGEAPSAAVLQEMLNLFVSDPVDVLVLNTQTESAVTDQVLQAAERAGVPVVRMSETLTAPDYLTWMGGQIDALTQALDG